MQRQRHQWSNTGRFAFKCHLICLRGCGIGLRCLDGATVEVVSANGEVLAKYGHERIPPCTPSQFTVEGQT